MFGIPGVQLDWAVDALRKAENQIRYMVPRHEQATSYMADGFARTTGKPGVCMVVPGPGVLNAAAGLVDGLCLQLAACCASPGTSTPRRSARATACCTRSRTRRAVLDQVTKWRGQARTPEEVPGLVRRASRR